MLAQRCGVGFCPPRPFAHPHHPLFPSAPFLQAKLEGRLPDLFPPARRTPADLASHFAAAGLQPLVDFQNRKAADVALGELRGAVDEMVCADPPHEADAVLTVVKAKQAEAGLGDADVIRVLWSSVAGAVPTAGRSGQQVLAALTKQVKAYAPLLRAYTTSARAEGALMVHVQARGGGAGGRRGAGGGGARRPAGASSPPTTLSSFPLLPVQVFCYEDPKLLKLFRDVVRLLYDQARGGVPFWILFLALALMPSPTFTLAPTPVLLTPPPFSLHSGRRGGGRHPVVVHQGRPPQGGRREEGVRGGGAAGRRGAAATGGCCPPRASRSPSNPDPNLAHRFLRASTFL